MAMPLGWSGVCSGIPHCPLWVVQIWQPLTLFVHSAHIINVTRSVYDAGIYKVLTGDKELKYNDYLL